jgi:hypothetical protein
MDRVEAFRAAVTPSPDNVLIKPMMCVLVVDVLLRTLKHARTASSWMSCFIGFTRKNKSITVIRRETTDIANWVEGKPSPN